MTSSKTVLDNTEELLQNGNLLGYKYIVIHHTATSTGTTIKQIKDSWQRRFKRPAAHYIIAYDGSWEKVLEIDKNAGSTRNNGINNYAIQIEIIGNFQTRTGANGEQIKYGPSEDQYKTARYLISEIKAKKEKGNKLEIIGHRDASASACPGDNFDFDKLSELAVENVAEIAGEKKEKISYKKVDGELLGTFRITQYHPCTGSHINDSAAQGGSCDVAASGLPLINDYAGKVVACPPEFSIGRTGTKREKLKIEGLGVVECVDRGGAIVGKHLDLFVGVGTIGKQNFDNGVFKEGVGYRKVWYVE